MIADEQATVVSTVVRSPRMAGYLFLKANVTVFHFAFFPCSLFFLSFILFSLSLSLSLTRVCCLVQDQTSVCGRKDIMGADMSGESGRKADMSSYTGMSSQPCR